MSLSTALALTRLPLGADFAVTANTIPDLAERATHDILALGNAPTTYAKLGILEQYIADVRERIKPAVIEALTESDFQHDALTLSLTTTRKYDYSASTEWQDVAGEEKKFAEHRKALEDMMKKNGTARVASESKTVKMGFASTAKKAQAAALPA
jgi:hypothetical protein